VTLYRKHSEERGAWLHKVELLKCLHLIRVPLWPAMQLKLSGKSIGGCGRDSVIPETGHLRDLQVTVTPPPALSHSKQVVKKFMLPHNPHYKECRGEGEPYLSHTDYYGISWVE